MHGWQNLANLITSTLLLFTLPALAQTPTELDKFTGAYKATPILIFYVSRDGSDLLVHLSTGHKDEMLLVPQGLNRFTETRSGAQFIFSGEGPEMVMTAARLPMVYHARRISPQAAKAQEDAIAARVKADVPSPGTEASLRRYIASMEDGAPNYDEMEPHVAADLAGRLPDTLAKIEQLGALKSLTFESVSGDGMDVYDAEFEHGRVDLGLAPLDPDGKVEFRDFHMHY
jgi:hypothetical protein